MKKKLRFSKRRKKQRKRKEQRKTRKAKRKVVKMDGKVAETEKMEKIIKLRKRPGKKEMVRQRPLKIRVKATQS